MFLGSYTLEKCVYATTLCDIAIFVITQSHQLNSKFMKPKDYTWGFLYAKHPNLCFGYSRI